MTWSHEDGGPRRQQIVPGGGLGVVAGGTLEVTTRVAPVTTMAVARDERMYLLRHAPGDRSSCCVERIDPVSLEPLERSVDLDGGPVWPGGLGVAADGSVHVVFGNHAHRLGPNLVTLASRRLPRDRPYNSFVPLPDGHLVTKDFGGSLPGRLVPAEEREPCQLVVLEPVRLEIVSTLTVPEPSIARLSADGDDVYVVGDTSLLRARWTGAELVLDDGFRATYRTLDGQTYGWDCVIAAGSAWFLDDGDGAEGYSGTLRGHGVSTAPLHLVRVDLGSGAVSTAEICGLSGGLVANPPVVDASRGVVVGYDSGNGRITAFDLDSLAVRWRREQDHGSHLVLYEETGELVTGDGDDVVILDVASGHELARASSGHGIQSVLFPTPGLDGDVYVCSFMGISRVRSAR
ncbi:MAG: hypothetical protein JO291_09035 [Acidimicrobiia bacterium]|nr:hypothetical protein [Acidimicrobiia bacterium]